MKVAELEAPPVLVCATDVVIVGGGLSGTLAATLLARKGIRVCLVDRHSTYPADFRTEHLDEPQVLQLRRLSALHGLTYGVPRGERITLAGGGRVIARRKAVTYGIRYEMLVNRAREMLPPSVEVVVGRVADIRASATCQHIYLSDGRTIRGRLMVLATGSGFALCQKVGIRRRLLREAHSLTFGFDIEPSGAAYFEHPFLVYQREILSERVDYLAAFTIGSRTRVNLFTYRDHRAASIRAFRDDPNAGLAKMLPRLTEMMGAYRVTSQVRMRPADLYVSENYRRDGVVMIGGAFQAACPAAGFGVTRLLTDIEQLCTIHVPRWLKTAGMGVEKIQTFYDDPVKLACDAKAMHDAEYRRALCTETTLGWRLHRSRVRATERLWGWKDRILDPPRLATRTGAAEETVASAFKDISGAAEQVDECVGRAVFTQTNST